MEKGKSNSRFIHVAYFKDCHRFFRDLQTGQLALADESGYFPNETDCGVLYVDFTRQAERYGRSNGEIGYNVPLKTQEQFEEELPGDCHFGSDVKEFLWLKSQGMRLKRDVPSEEPKPKLVCPQCEHQEFVGHQIVRMEVVVDNRKNWLRNMCRTAEASIYDSEPPYGPFSCVMCGKEAREDG